MDISAPKISVDFTLNPALPFDPTDARNFAEWVKIHDRVSAGEMPPKVITQRPNPAAQQAFLQILASSLTAAEQKATATQGRVTERRLNAYEYENALRDLLQKIQESSASGGTTFIDCATGYCGVFAKSITCTIDTNIQDFATGGRWSCTYVDGQ